MNELFHKKKQTVSQDDLASEKNPAIIIINEAGKPEIKMKTELKTGKYGELMFSFNDMIRFIKTLVKLHIS